MEIEDLEIHVELLNNAAFISYEICSVLNYLPQSNMSLSVLTKSINEIISDGRIYASPQLKNRSYILQGFQYYY